MDVNFIKLTKLNSELFNFKVRQSNYISQANDSPEPRAFQNALVTAKTAETHPKQSTNQNRFWELFFYLI